ncbi:MAG TPA: hypothetical protein VK584_14545, partial [Streptosporangiaceae bacterium]|nr:hypothetical protein [Streptosporangiaceae bacterium]
NRRSRPGGGAVRGRPGLLPKRPHPRTLTAASLVLAAAGLVALDLAGLAAPSARMLMLLCAPVAAGLAVALAASLRAAGPVGAIAGLVLLLAGLVAGYLAAGAVQLRAYRRHHGARGAHRAGDGGRALDADRGDRRWSRRTGPGLHRKAPDRRLDPEPGRNRDREQRPVGPGEVASGAPVPGRVPRSIMGKLTTVANRIVDRGESCVCPVKERRCQNTLSS